MDESMTEDDVLSELQLYIDTQERYKEGDITTRDIIKRFGVSEGKAYKIMQETPDKSDGKFKRLKVLKDGVYILVLRKVM